MVIHGHPAALEEVRAPEVPIRVRERFPIDLGVVTHVQGVDPAKRCIGGGKIAVTVEGGALVD